MDYFAGIYPQSEEEKMFIERSQNYVDEIMGPLIEMIDVINSNVNVNVVEIDNKKKLLTSITLDAKDIDAFVLKIPSLTVYLQTQLNKVNLETMIKSIIIENEVTRGMKTRKEGKISVTERQRDAALDQETQLLVLAVQKGIYKAGNDLIARAIMVYEGLKKIIDGQKREDYLNNKIA